MADSFVLLIHSGLGVRRPISVVARKREGRKGEGRQKGSRKMVRCSTDRSQETKVRRGPCDFPLREERVAEAGAEVRRDGQTVSPGRR